MLSEEATMTENTEKKSAEQVRCNTLIDLSKPDHADGNGMKTVFTYRCPTCQREHAIKAMAVDQGVALPPIGSIECGSALKVN